MILLDEAVSNPNGTLGMFCNFWIMGDHDNCDPFFLMQLFENAQNFFAGLGI